MTLWPVDQRDVIDRSDLPAYELNEVCSAPGCDFEGAENHHIFRRSGQTKSWWVELADGTVLPNRTLLCFGHHRDVTGGIGGHKARIVWDTGSEQFLWQEFVNKAQTLAPLNPHPPLRGGLGTSSVSSGSETSSERGLPASGPLRREEPSYGASPPLGSSEGDGADTLPPPSDSSSGLTEAVPEVRGSSTAGLSGEAHAEGNEAYTATVSVSPGEVCPTCERKKPHPRKPSSPTSKVKSLRMPVDDYPAFTETLEACAEYLGTASQPFSDHKVITLGLGLILQDESLRGFAEREAA